MTLTRKEKNKDKIYEKHLNDTCKIHFKWGEDKKKEITYRDLTGPEKLRLFKNTDISQLFPLLPNNNKIQKLWSDFFLPLFRI